MADSIRETMDKVLGAIAPSSETGPTGTPKCPKCLNTLQNAICADSTPGCQVMRCASCKHVWEYKPLSDVEMQEVATRLSQHGIVMSPMTLEELGSKIEKSPEFIKLDIRFKEADTFKLSDYKNFEEVLKNPDIYLSVAWNESANCYTAHLNDMTSATGWICQGNGVSVDVAIANLKEILWPTR